VTSRAPICLNGIFDGKRRQRKRINICGHNGRDFSKLMKITYH
jgi:hypothetical protein